MIFFIFTTLTLLTILLAPCLIVMFWQKRRIAAYVTALLLSFIISVAPSLIRTFQAMMIYGSGDPQLMAGGISSAIVSAVFGTIIYIPVLFLFQWFGRLRKRKRERAKLDKNVFE